MEKDRIYNIEQRLPLGQWQWAETGLMTFAEACGKCAVLLAENGGNAVETRFCELWKYNYIYIPQWLD